MANKELVVRSDDIDSEEKLIAVGENGQIIDQTWSSNVRAFLAGVKVAYGPKGTKIDIKANDRTINPNAKDIGSFPKKYRQMVDLGKGATLKVFAQHTKAKPAVVRVILDVLTHTEG